MQVQDLSKETGRAAFDLLQQLGRQAAADSLVSGFDCFYRGLPVTYFLILFGCLRLVRFAALFAECDKLVVALQEF